MGNIKQKAPRYIPEAFILLVIWVIWHIAMPETHPCLLWSSPTFSGIALLATADGVLPGVGVLQCITKMDFRNNVVNRHLDRIFFCALYSTISTGEIVSVKNVPLAPANSLWVIRPHKHDFNWNVNSIFRSPYRKLSLTS